MKDIQLKYRIRELIDLKGRTNKRKQELREEIREKCGGISNVTLSRWENKLMGDKGDISLQHASNIAQVLECSSDDLLNKPKK